ncbi:hypothetical protein [Streptomyces sp. Midd1]|uniref:hypothetical protein n=1 Tax=Streptomyces sp. Midd3 TaxID=3161191 RepID=UPI0034DAFAA9
MSSGEFKYLPHVLTQPGDRDETVQVFWEMFREYNQGFADLRFHFTDRKPKPARHDRCTQPPLMFTRVQHHDETGRLTHTTSHPDLLSSASWAAYRNDRISFTRPAYFANEIGDRA